MHIHILGICGTFMGGIAQIAKQAGYEVSGSDVNVYPPMSTQLSTAGISLSEGHRIEDLRPAPDKVVVGNVMCRGNPVVEHLLNEAIPFTSGPQWLSEHVLQHRWVLAVAGTHGKTTTTSLLAWILEFAGLGPGFLIGGVAQNLGVSARLGESRYFVIEADEYDTAFFDKRSKFIHYQPRTLILNNLEFDHADIFKDLTAIQQQFHHLIRTVPSEGLIVTNNEDKNLDHTLALGCWTPRQGFSLDGADTDWSARLLTPDGSRFQVLYRGKSQGEVAWSQLGRHNVMNALAAIAAAHHVGVSVSEALGAVANFQGVKRRLEVRGVFNGITLYDDFAHHPTAIASTLRALRARVGSTGRLIAVFEPRSNTMRMGIHKDSLDHALAEADAVYLYQSDDLDWSLNDVCKKLAVRAVVIESIPTMIERLATELVAGDQVVIMSNGSFGGLHEKLAKRLELNSPHQRATIERALSP